MLRTIGFALISLSLGGAIPGLVAAQEQATRPSFSQIASIVDQHFGALGTRPNDLITKSQVRSLFAKFDAVGWKFDEQDDLLDSVLSDSASIVRLLRSRNGQKFIQQVGRYKLIYDRLDRIAKEPGGQQLLTDLMKLPDAHRYAKQNTQAGVPDLIDFLPKDRSGKTRRVKDYDKATGKLYLVADLKKALEEAYNSTTPAANP